MPTNLNALIRYKQIDACLKNPYKNCTISYLQEICTQLMGEKRGIYKLVSDRTIRDDIRVLKSDILGFNAPIVFEDGRYFYSEPDYTIFTTPLTEKELLKDILQVLFEERKKHPDKEIDRLLERIMNIIGEEMGIASSNSFMVSEEKVEEKPKQKSQGLKSKQHLKSNEITILHKNRYRSFIEKDASESLVKEDYMQSPYQKESKSLPKRSNGLMWNAIFDLI